MLGAPAAQALAMVLHELTTNAVKFGALAGDHGLLRLRWSRDAAGGLDLLWQEQGALAAVGEEPAGNTRGFGLSLIESAVRRQLCGSLETHRRPSGLEVRIRIPPEELARS
jgi:two-component sensor histidine kinase